MKRAEMMESIMVIVAVTIIASVFGIVTLLSQLKSYDTEYKEFKNNTEIINGEVSGTEEQSKGLLNSNHFLRVKTKDNRNIRVSVNEKIYNNYQKGSEIKFRISNNKNNVVKDLKTQKDIKTLKDYRNYKNVNDSLFEKLSKAFLNCMSN